MDIQKILNELTIEEKISLVIGTNFMYTNQIDRLGIRSLVMSDGPHGLRKQTSGGDNGVSESEPATCFPTAVTIANSWNAQNAYLMGQAIANECSYYGVDVILGPGVNIKRNPLCGRNFEYYSEDPILAGRLGTEFVKGVQSKNVGVAVKHFALNNLENFRFVGNSICDERAMREIYLKPFEMITKESSPMTIMCAYEKINDTYCSKNDWLLNKVLRDEWQFNGFVMSDWGATKERDICLKAGLDLEMPGDKDVSYYRLVNAINDKTLDMKDLDQGVKRILEVINKTSKKEKIDELPIEKHNELAKKIAIDGAVLLKNDQALPLKNTKICVVGELFDYMRYQGSGSSMIHPTKITTPKNAFDKENVSYEYKVGYKNNTEETDEILLNEALSISKDYEAVLVFAGLTDFSESEGGDRETMSLPKNQLDLIDKLLESNKKVNIVLFGGSAIELPFADKVASILYMGLPGQAGGEATYNLLFGKANPSGRLQETWVNNYNDVPYANDYSKNIDEYYKESIYVGYRYYNTFDKKVLFPFGYGLSYTSFEYKDLIINKNQDEIIVTIKIKNTGEMAGSEVVQLYIESPRINLFRPKKELKAFTKVFLMANEEKEVTLKFKESDLAYFNPNSKQWNIEKGNYIIHICKNVNDTILSKDIYIDGIIEKVYEDDIINAYKNPSDISNEIFEKITSYKIVDEIKVLPLTMDSRFIDFKKRLLGKVLYNAVCSVSKKQIKKAKKMEPSIERDNKLKGGLFLQRIFDTNSLETMSMSAGKSMPYNIAEMMCDIANGRIIHGLCHLKNKYKNPKIKKEENK